MTRTSRITRTVLAVTVAGAALAGCSGSDSDDTPSTTETHTSTSVSGETSAPATGETSPFAEEIAARGAPTPGATAAVTELQVTDDIVGTGATVEAGATITAHYVGVSASTGETFDSSWTRGSAATFPLDQVITGWSEGLVGMQEGGRRTLVIPSALGYGDSGTSGIAPGETLVFTVDLVSVDS